MQNNGDIVVRYKATDNKSSDNKKDKSQSKSNSTDIKNNRKIRAFAVLLFFAAILLLLSLISYTSTDESNATLGISSWFELLLGNEDMQARAKETSNWLGFAGAFISHFLYNSTFGYLAFFIPFLLIIAAKSLFFKLTLSDKFYRYSIFFLLFALIASSFIASTKLIGWIPDLSKEWSGVIGMFIADILSSVISPLGALLLLFAGLIAFTFYIVNIEPNTIANIVKKLIEVVKMLKRGKAFNRLSKILSREKKQVTNDKVSKIESPTPKTDLSDLSPHFDNLDNEEPARIIKQNLSINIRKNESAAPNEILSTHDNSRQIAEDEIAKQLRHNFRINKAIDEPVDIPPTDEVENDEAESNRPLDNINKFIENSDVCQKFVAVEIPKYKPSVQKNNLPVKSGESNRTKVTIPDSAVKQEFEINPEPIQEIEQNYLDNFVEPDYRETPLENEPKPLESDAIIERSPIEEINSKPLVLTLQKKESNPIALSSPSEFPEDEELDYLPPHSGLLIAAGKETPVDEEELKQNARILQEKLETFKILIDNLDVTPGPVVTQYELIPAPGIKISRIESLSDDLAMALKAKGIRIIAPIPGKGTIGIEIPNQNPAIVRFSSLVESPEFINSDHKLPIAFGKTISGDVFVADLAKMPHLLIAGSTGSGKSVGINTLIASLIYKKHPKDLKFIVIDPKKVELQQYSALEHHFMAKSPDIDDTIITNPKDAVLALNSVVLEMERRYDTLASVGQRNITEYNKKVAEGRFKHISEVHHSEMPYIVLIIDELADLMITASKEIEEPITRLAQMARAVGIHLVVATQRPSVDVITGVIKANFPARIAYLVASKVDSRTILDSMGAEQLLGNGDMLFLPNGQPKPIRIQNSLITTDEVDDICNFIGSQQGYSMPYLLPSLQAKKTGDNADTAGFDRDPLFEEAARLIIRHQQGSVSLIQRRLKVGYARAGRIVDELESAGVVGPFDGSKARQVRMESESELEAIL